MIGSHVPEGARQWIGGRRQVRLLALLLAGAAMPRGVIAAILDLGNTTVARNNFDQVPGRPYDAVQNGVLKLSANANQIYAGVLRDGANAFSLEKLGNARLTLTGANSFSGDTLITSGTLAAGAVDTLSPLSRIRVGSTLYLGGFSQTVAGVYQTGGIISVGGTDAVLTLNVPAASSSRFFGTITETRTARIGIVKAGSGTQFLGGPANYSLGTVLNGGTLAVGLSTALGLGAVTFAMPGASLVIDGTDLVISNALRLDVDARISGIAPLLTGKITGPGALIKTGQNSITLSNPLNDYRGGTELQTGILLLGGDDVLGSGALHVVAVTELGTAAISARLSNAIKLDANLYVMAPVAGAVLELAGSITGSGGLRIQKGSGTVLVSHDNQYSDITYLVSGTLGVANNQALGSNSLFASTATGELITLKAFANGLNITNRVRVGSVLAIDTNGFEMALDNIQDGNATLHGGIVKAGAGNLTLRNAGSYSLGTTLRGGILSVAGDDRLGAASGNLIFDGGTLRVTGTAFTATPRSITLITVGGFDIADAANIFVAGQPIGGAGALVKSGAGTLRLDVDNAYAGGTTVAAGTLAIRDNGALGAGAVTLAGGRLLADAPNLRLGNAVVASGGTVDTAAATLTLAGPLSGGALTKAGFGTLVLAGANTATGGLTVAAGEVQLAAGSGLGSGTAVFAGSTTLTALANVALANPFVLNGAVTMDDRGNVISLGGAVAGPGALTKTGSGTLDLGAASSYVAGTTLVSGTLGVADAAALGTGPLVLGGGVLRANTTGLTLLNAVVVGGAATIDSAANTLTLAGVQSGAGALTKSGGGKLILTGASTRGGATTIAAGTLTGSVATLGAGGIADNAALVFDQRLDASYAGTITGTGSVTKTGAGNLMLAGNSGVSGATALSAGRLIVTGTLAASTVTSGGGTILGGTGRIGGLVAMAGSTVSPGVVDGGVGTLSVAGNASFAPGATFAVNVTPAAADRLTIDGAASLGGALTLTAAPGPYRLNATYTLLSAAAGRTGVFVQPALDIFGPTYAPVLIYGPDTVVLRLLPARLGGLLPPGSYSPNITNRLAAFDAAVADGLDPQPFLGLYGLGSELGPALSQLTGEIHSAASRAAIDDQRHVREAVFNRLETGLAATLGSRDRNATRHYGGGATTLWARAIGAWGTSDADGNGAALDDNVTGVIAGADADFDGVRVGALFSFLDSDTRTAVLGKARVRSTGGGLYGGYRREGGLAFGAGGSAASVRADTSRTTTIPGLNQMLSARRGGIAYQGFAEIAYDLAAASSARFEPFVRFATVVDRADALLESGGPAAVTAPRQTFAMSIAAAGVRGSAVLGGGALAVRFSAAYQHTGGDRAPVAQLALTGTRSFAAIRAVPVDRDAVAGEAGVEVRLARQAVFSAAYSGVIGRNVRDNGIKATLTIGF